MSSIYWIISGRVRASEQACKALTRSNDNGKKQDGNFLRFNRPEKKSLPHYHMWLNISFGKFCHLFLWPDPSPEQWLTMWLNFYFGKCCLILSLVLVTGLVTRTVTMWLNFSFWKCCLILSLTPVVTATVTMSLNISILCHSTFSFT